MSGGTKVQEDNVETRVRGPQARSRTNQPLKVPRLRESINKTTDHRRGQEILQKRRHGNISQAGPPEEKKLRPQLVEKKMALRQTSGNECWPMSSGQGTINLLTAAQNHGKRWKKQKTSRRKKGRGVRECDRRGRVAQQAGGRSTRGGD